MTEFTWAKFIHRYHVTTPSLLVIYKTGTYDLSYICFSQNLVVLHQSYNQRSPQKTECRDYCKESSNYSTVISIQKGKFDLSSPESTSNPYIFCFGTAMQNSLQVITETCNSALDYLLLLQASPWSFQNKREKISKGAASHGTQSNPATC